MSNVNPEMVITARESRGMTQRDLAQATNIKPYRLSKLENSIGHFSEDELESIGAKTGFHTAFFYRRDRLIGLGLRELVEDLQVVEPTREVVIRSQVVVEPREVRHELARGVGIVPEVGCRGSFAELFSPGALDVYVKDRP